MKITKMESLNEAASLKDYQDDVKRQFTLTLDNVAGENVETFTSKTLGPIKKRISAFLSNKQDLADRGITSIEVVNSDGDEVYLNMQDEGTVDEEGNSNNDGEWVVAYDMLDKTAQSQGISNDVYSHVYSDLCKDIGLAEITSMRMMNGVTEKQRYDSDSLAAADDGIKVLKGNDFTYAKQVANFYGLPSRIDRYGNFIITTEGVDIDLNKLHESMKLHEGITDKESANELIRTISSDGLQWDEYANAWYAKSGPWYIQIEKWVIENDEVARFLDDESVDEYDDSITAAHAYIWKDNDFVTEYEGSSPFVKRKVISFLNKVE